MPYSTLYNTIAKPMDSHTDVTYIWHGGEPLLVPLDFYRKAVEFQSQFPNTKARNGFQSNGTLVTDEVLDFCSENKFDIGFSLDGPKNVNDRTRRFRTGESSFSKTLDAIKRAQQRRVGGGAIVVVSRYNVDDLPGIYEFAVREGVNLKINPLIRSGRACDNYGNIGIGSKEYGEALVKLFDVWYNDGASIKVDPFEELMGNLLTEQPWGCNFSRSCQDSFISIGPLGDIYPCGRFDGVHDFRLGNIDHDNLDEVLASQKRAHLKGRSARIKHCEPCDYRPICNSGCMHNAYMIKGNIDDPDFYCASYKLLFEHIGPLIEKELEKAVVEDERK